MKSIKKHFIKMQNANFMMKIVRLLSKGKVGNPCLLLSMVYWVFILIMNIEVMGMAVPIRSPLNQYGHLVQCMELIIS